MQKNYCSIFKITKTTFFDSKTLSTCYVNMRLKTTLIPFVGKHIANTILYLIQKYTAEYKWIYFIHVR